MWGRLAICGRLLIGLIALLAAFLAGCGTPHSRANGKQVIVLGIDGMDPSFVERHWADLPNLARMRSQGSFSRLATTTPPQSPTAWSTFITGLDASEHGIFDFVHRDPATMQPFLSMSQTTPARFRIPLGPYELPLVRSQVVLLRKGKAFWQTLGEHGIPATIVHMPVNYPPVDSGEGLAGMGTPDLRGTQSTFSYYTDDPGDTPRAVSGGVIVRAEVTGGRAVLRLKGPPNTLRRDQRASATKIIIDVDPVQPLAHLAMGDSVGIVREGEWSDWLAADFPLVPYLVSVRGMVRVFAKQLHPRFEVYVSPINADPSSPDLPVSTPSSFSRDISSRIGRFYTLGTPEDTAAMRQGVFDLPEFLSQSRLVLDEERKLLDYSLDRFRDGLLFFYFSSVDQNSHMLWGQHEAELLKVYRAVDAAIGEVRRRKPSAELMVMSDHGFASFDRWVDLNHWLHEEKLLTLKNESQEIDWERTKAYALGLNGLYVNVVGREHPGRIPDGMLKHALMERISSALLALRDPANGRAPIEKVVATNVTGPNARIAPDLIVGYAPGYRVSWETGAGGLADATFGDNTDAWIADHCINAADVPGVLFTTRKVQPINPRLKDLPVSLLALFDIAPEPGTTGHSIY